MTNYYTLATGIKVSPEDLRIAGERINNLAKLFNIREGVGSREFDSLPPKIMTVPIPDEGVAKGSVVNQEEFDLGLDDYYAVRGWTKKGIPTVEKLKELNLEEYASIVKTGGK